MNLPHYIIVMNCKIQFFCLNFSIWLKSLSVQVTNRKGYARNSEFWKPFLTSKGIEGIYITLN